MPQRLLLGALPAAVELVPYQGHHMKGIHPGEPVHRDDLDPVPERLGLGFEPGLERLLRAALEHGQKA